MAVEVFREYNVTWTGSFTGRTFADVFWWSWWLNAQPAVLTVMVLTNSAEVVLNSPGYGSNLAEPAGVATRTHTAIAVDAVLTGGSVLTDVWRAVVNVLRTVLTAVTTWTVASTHTRTPSQGYVGQLTDRQSGKHTVVVSYILWSDAENTLQIRYVVHRLITIFPASLPSP